jgi:hypothetical protein
MGISRLYNESLGNRERSYQYDRVKDHDQTELERRKRRWGAAKVKVVTAAKKSRA